VLVPPVGNSKSKIDAVGERIDFTRVRGWLARKKRGRRETLWRAGHGSNESFAPLGLDISSSYPRLAPWAAFFHRFAVVAVDSLALEERGWAPLPGLAFFYGCLFHVVHVGAGLGQDVVQIVADADEGESLFEEFADARGAEEE